MGFKFLFFLILFLFFSPWVSASGLCPSMSEYSSLEDRLNERGYTLGEPIELPQDSTKLQVPYPGYGQPLMEWLGVTTFANDLRGRKKYQCTELVHRFVRTVFGFETRLGLGMGHGYSLARGMSRHFEEKTTISPHTDGTVVMVYEGTTNCSLENQRPHVGSVISFQHDRSKYGHTGVVRSIEKISDNEIELRLLEQNIFPRGYKKNNSVQYSYHDKKYRLVYKDNVWQTPEEDKNKNYFYASGWINFYSVHVSVAREL